MSHWLPLTEYANKYKVSISTLRRRIKAEDIQFMFEDGKYLINDGPMDLHRPSLGTTPMMKEQTSHRPSLKTAPEFEPTNMEKEESLLGSANRLLSELKKAYAQILQDKEEQILHLKEEVADLKTLVRVLEGENDRILTTRQY